MTVVPLKMLPIGCYVQSSLGDLDTSSINLKGRVWSDSSPTLQSAYRPSRSQQELQVLDTSENQVP